MGFRYSPDVNILMVFIAADPFDYGEDNESVIVHHSKDGTPFSLEILDAILFVLLANSSLLTGQEVVYENLPSVPFAKEHNVPIRTIPKLNAAWRFKYQADGDVLTMKFGTGASDLCRTNHEISVSYDQNELPMGLENSKVHEFVLNSVKSVLLHDEVSIA